MELGLPSLLALTTLAKSQSRIPFLSSSPLSDSVFPGSWNMGSVEPEMLLSGMLDCDVTVT